MWQKKPKKKTKPNQKQKTKKTNKTKSKQNPKTPHPASLKHSTTSISSVVLHCQCSVKHRASHSFVFSEAVVQSSHVIIAWEWQNGKLFHFSFQAPHHFLVPPSKSLFSDCSVMFSSPVLSKESNLVCGSGEWISKSAWTTWRKKKKKPSRLHYSGRGVVCLEGAVPTLHMQPTLLDSLMDSLIVIHRLYLWR